jgi:hypothetical protein
MEVTCSSEISVFAGATERHIPEDGILHGHHHENLESYMECLCSCILNMNIIGNMELHNLSCRYFLIYATFIHVFKKVR